MRISLVEMFRNRLAQILISPAHIGDICFTPGQLEDSEQPFGDEVYVLLIKNSPRGHAFIYTEIIRDSKRIQLPLAASRAQCYS